jgi:hypothetical protein
MLTMWFAEGCLRFVGWQLSVIEALTLMLLLRTLKRLKRHQQEALLRRLENGEA